MLRLKYFLLKCRVKTQRAKTACGFEEQRWNMAILQCCRNAHGYCEQLQGNKKQKQKNPEGRAGSVHCAETVTLERVKTHVKIRWFVIKCKSLQFKWWVGAFRWMRKDPQRPVWNSRENNGKRLCITCLLMGNFKQMSVCIWPTYLGFVIEKWWD